MAYKKREYEEIELSSPDEIEAVHAGRLDGFVYADGAVYADADKLYDYRQRQSAERGDSIANSIDVEAG
jgi:hypothetical protein